MTFEEWMKTSEAPLYLSQSEQALGKAAWNAVLKECKDIIESMEGCTDVDYCKRDGLKQLEELR